MDVETLTYSVLVVDDDEALRQMICRALSEKYIVHGARDAAHALAVLEVVPTPDLILCDVMMPGIDGITFVRQIRQTQRFKRVPVIFLTANTSTMTMIEAINAGARNYLTKPFKVGSLIERVDKAVHTR